MISIYGLIDPRSNEVRYIGKSANPTERLATHVREARQGHVLHSRRWIDGLLKSGMRPDLWVIDRASTHSDANELERFWIASFRLMGANLTNRTDGGDGQSPGYRPSAEVVEKIASKRRGSKASPETRERMRTAFNTPEMRALRSQNTKRLANSPEWREKIGRGNRGKRLSEETKRKQSASWTPERKAAHAKEKSALPFDDRWRAQLAAAIKARWDKYRADGCPKRTYSKKTKTKCSPCA